MKKAKLIAGMTTQLAATVLRAPLSRRSSRGGGSHMRLRWLLVILSAVVPLLIGPISAQAATASSTAHTAAASPAPQVAAPTGCPKGDVCFYYQGNGGTSTLCGYTDTNSTNLHGLAPFGATCSNIGPSGSIYNNGNTCSGCSGTKLYYDNAYAGAWYCLPMGVTSCTSSRTTSTEGVVAPTDTGRPWLTIRSRRTAPVPAGSHRCIGLPVRPAQHQIARH